jgi:lipoprotein-anchoring transpeptidase ErfK/SrfK
MSELKADAVQGPHPRDLPGAPARRPALVAVTLALVVLLAGCGGSAPADPAPAAPAAPSTTTPKPKAGPVALGRAPAYVALATTDVTVRSRPRAGGIVGLFPRTTPWGSPTAFLVEGARRNVTGETWLKVLVPRRPNESTGWVRRDQVRLEPVDYAVEVSLSARTVRLLRAGREVASWPAGVGRSYTPTPTGRFFVTVKLRPPQISSVYGAWALGLSGYSEVHQQFGTGDGQIALHGTNNPGTDLGREVSNGCVRLDNQAITTLAETLPVGTPVTIRA